MLPQGMKHSPTMCQYYVFQVLLNDPSMNFVHYMNDILLDHYDSNKLEEIFQLTLTSLNNVGLEKSLAF